MVVDDLVIADFRGYDLVSAMVASGQAYLTDCFPLCSAFPIFHHLMLCSTKYHWLLTVLRYSVRRVVFVSENLV